MEEMTDRQLRYTARERRSEEDERRRLLEDIQNQRQRLSQLRADEAQYRRRDSQDSTQIEVMSHVPPQREDTRLAESRNTEKLDYASRLSFQDGSLYTIDDTGSQLSEDPFVGRTADYRTGLDRSRLRDSDRHGQIRYMPSEENEFDRLLDELQINSGLRRQDTSQEVRPLTGTLTEEKEDSHQEPAVLSRRQLQRDGTLMLDTERTPKISGHTSDLTRIRDVTDTLSHEGSDTSLFEREEQYYRARIERLALQQRRLKEERLQRQTEELEMDRKLKALQLRQKKAREEAERQERLKTLKKQATEMEMSLLEEEREDREWRERMNRMEQQTRIIEEGILRRGSNIIQTGSAAPFETDIVDERWHLRDKFGEVGRQRALEDELRRRETIIKQEMEEGRQNIGYERAKAQNTKEWEVQIRYEEEERARKRDAAYRRDIEEQMSRREEQLRRQFTEELRKKELELERKEEVLQRLKRQLENQHGESEPNLDLLRRIEDLENKESCLHSYEEELQTEEKAVRPDALNAKETTSPAVTHFIKPYLTQFSGAEPTPKNEVSFEDWRSETKCLLKSNVYPDYIVTQAIRNSLKGQARRVLATLDPLTSSEGIVSKLESLFGNVASGLSILQEFYTASQKEDESVTMWGLRIEEILQRAIEKGEVAPERKNHLLKDKFWRSLYSLDLKIATKIHFDKIADFEILRGKVREEERELQTHKSTASKSASTLTSAMDRQGAKEKKTEELQHQPLQLEQGAAKFYNDLSKRLERIEKLCSYRRRRQNQNQKRQDSGKQPDQTVQEQNTQQKKPDSQKTEDRAEPLNKDKPPLQGK